MAGFCIEKFAQKIELDKHILMNYIYVVTHKLIWQKLYIKG